MQMKSAPKKILVVEDDLSTLEMLRVFLSKGGYEVMIERSGTKIYELVKEKMPDVILLDAVLPGMDGYTIQKKLFNDPATQSIPIIMISANLQLEQVFVGKENVLDFLHKPFNVNDLRDKISKVIKG